MLFMKSSLIFLGLIGCGASLLTRISLIRAQQHEDEAQLTYDNRALIAKLNVK